MGNFKIFSNGDFNLQYFIYEDEYFFKAIDVARNLKYKNPDDAVRKHVKDKYKVRFGDLLSENDTPAIRGGINFRGRHAILISLPGLLQFLTQSQMPAAEPFQDWVFEQILPSIVKTGEYRIGPEKQVQAILDKVDESNRPSLRKMFLKASEHCKDEDKSKKGKKGGEAFWRNYNADLKKENVKYKDRFRQLELDLSYFRVLSQCLDP